MNFRELITHWGFKVDHAPLEKVETQLEGIKSRLEFLMAGEILKGIYEMTERFAHFAEELHVSAINAGLTVEAFQKLAFAADKSGVSSEEMSGAMARLSRNLYQAKLGSAETQKVFADAGFSQDQIAGFKTSKDVMLALADRFQHMQDPMKKTAISMALMGRSGFQMTAFLSQGSAAIKGMGDEADRLGITLGSNQVEALVKVEHSLREFWGVLKAVGATIASYFAPSIKDAIDEFLNFYAANRKLIDVNIRAWVWDITYALGYVWGIVKFVAQAFFDFAEKHQLLVRRIGEVLIGLGLFVGALFVFNRVLSVVRGGLSLFTGGLSVLRTIGGLALKPLLYFAGLFQQALVFILQRLALLIVDAFPALGEAVFAFGAALEATPVGWFLTAIAAIVVVVHDLWKILTGKWEETWIYQLFKLGKGALGGIMKFFGLGGEGAGVAGAGEAVKGIANQGMESLKGLGNMFGSVENAQASSPGDSTSPEMGGQSYAVNAPITINVPAGADHKDIGKHVQAGVREHLDRVQRETYRSLRPAQAY